MRLAITCPMCGLWGNPGRFLTPKWPIRAFERKMGGRQPGSKRGIIHIKEVELPEDVLSLVIDEHLDLAEKMGIQSGYREERGITKGLWQDPLAFLTGAAAQAFVEKVPPLVGNATALGAGLVLSRGGAAQGGTGGKVARAAGLGLLGFEGGNFVRSVGDALSQRSTSETRVPLILVPVQSPNLLLPSPSICPCCHRPNDFPGMF